MRLYSKWISWNNNWSELALLKLNGEESFGFKLNHMAKVNEILKSKREERKVSLSTVHQETRISVRYLEALESGEWNIFPAEIYLHGFMRKYASYLGLNQEEIFLLFKKELSEPRELTTDKAGEHELILNTKNKKVIDLSPWVVVLFPILLFVLGYFAYLFFQHEPFEEKTVATGESFKKNSSDSPLLQERSLSLRLKAIHNVWVRVSGDQGKLLFEGFISPQAEQTWEAKKEITIRIGNVNGVELFLNEKPINIKSGALQAVNELHLTHQNLSLTNSSFQSKEVKSVKQN